VNPTPSPSGSAALAVEEQSRIDFVLALRRRWADRLYPTLADRARTASRDGRVVTTAVHEDALYPWFAWLERGSQKMLWRAVTDAVRSVPEPEDLSPAAVTGSLALDDDLALPDWYTSVDIHIQPGGIWRHDEQARVYELGAKLVMLGDNDDYAFHDLFAATAVPDRPYRRIVDLGCGFAKSTRPFKRRFPEADVIGVDLSAPVLRLGHRLAERSGVALDLRQGDATATGIAAGSVELVTATMLIHEMPPPVLADLMSEAARLLAPGGLVRILDFHPTGDPVRDLAMREHGLRNNEPYLPMLFDTDLGQLARDAGLVDARWVAFDERGVGRLDRLEWPERSEWHFPWAVFEATQPGAGGATS